MKSMRAVTAAAVAFAMLTLSIGAAFADDAFEADANAALKKLYESTPAAKQIGDQAKAILWELGVGPSIVVVDQGKAKSLTTTTLRDDVYAFIFDQKGLMAGLGLQGSKITKVEK
jgi:lipid-binding SYLF domain-containing protein